MAMGEDWFTKAKVVDDLNFDFWRSVPPSSRPSRIKSEGTNIAGQWINTGLGSGTFAVPYEDFNRASRWNYDEQRYSQKDSWP